MSQTSSLDKLRWGAFAALVVLGLSLCSYRYVSPSARRATATLEHLSAAHVSAVILEPSKDRPLIKEKRVITEPALVARWVAAVSPLESYLPNHPNRQECLFVSFVTSSGTVGGELCTVASGRPSLEQMSSISSGFDYGSYLLPRSVNLRALISASEGMSAAPNNSSKPTPLRGAA